MNKRPFFVWLIAIFYLLSTPFTLLSLSLVLSGTLPLTPEQEAYFSSLSTLDYLFSFAIGLTGFTGAVALFFLRRVALYLFCGSFALNVLMSIWHLMTRDFLSALPGGGLLGFILGLGILAAVCLYTWKLTRAGVLR